MGYSLGFIGVITHLLTIDPSFQRDIQVGCFSKLSFSIPPLPSLEGMDLHKKPTFTPKLFSRELGGWGWLLRLLRVCGWWFQIFFIFTPILDMIQFDQYFSNGVKPPTRYNWMKCPPKIGDIHFELAKKKTNHAQIAAGYSWIIEHDTLPETNSLPLKINFED